VPFCTEATVESIGSAQRSIVPESGVPSPASIQPFTVTVAAVAEVPAQQ